MKVALKSLIALLCCFCLSLSVYAGQAPQERTTATIVAPSENDPHHQAAQAYQLQYGQTEPTRKGGVLILAAGIALLFLSPLALAKAVPVQKVSHSR
ncbi:MAG: hypothetical protein AAGM67_08235 [Bacteroidota bacterium]